MDQAAGETWGTLAGFWVRLLADLIDTAFLFLVGLLLSIPFGPLLVRLGSRGVFIGLAVSLLYNGVLQSRLGTGQTLGKRWLRLTVVRMDGSLMSIERSLVRYAMVGYLVYQNAISTAIVTVLPFLRFEWIDVLQSGIACTLLVGYLLVPFHPLKRGLHDLLAGTIVVRRGMPDPVRMAALTSGRRNRQIVAAAIVLLVVATAAWPTWWAMLSRSPSFPHVTPLIADACSKTGVSNPLVFVRNSSHGGQRERTMFVDGLLAPSKGGNELNPQTVHDQLVRALKASLAFDQTTDFVGTTLGTGFDIGIFKSEEIAIRVENRRTGELVRIENKHIW